MIFNRHLPILSFLLLNLLPGESQAQISKKLGPTLDQVFEKAVIDYKTKGASAAIHFGDGSVWKAAGGKHGTEDLTVEMLFEMGSNTKTMVAAIVLQLADEGKLKLSDPVGKYLDSLAYVPQNITIKQLLNHTSGIYSYTNHPQFGSLLNADPTKKWQVGDIFSTLMKPVEFRAGTDWSYSNTNYILLGLIIEEVDGKKFHESLKTRLFAPNDLKHIFLDQYDSYTETLVGTWMADGSYLDIDFAALLSTAWAAGAAVSTPEDLAIWAHLLYSGKVVGDWTDSMTTLTKIGSQTAPYGLGMFHRKLRGKELLGHGGTTIQHSQMEYSADGDFSVVTAVNEQNGSSASLQIQNALLIAVWDGLKTIGLEENLSQLVSVYPNPSNGTFLVDVSAYSSNQFEVKVYNLTGRVLQTLNGSNDSVFQIEGLTQGNFLLEIISDKAILRKKILVL